jgi:type IV pilus assembly protein PilY1
MELANLRSFASRALTPSIAAAVTALGLAVAPPAMATPMVQIAQYPLTVAAPAHPQVLFALANSQSMDGNLSGAIMTGSGGLGAAYSGLNASTSPSTYIVPNGFTAPVSGATAGTNAAYTVNNAGTLYDNSNSRLNVAKAGLQGILTTFLPNADFALIDYQTSAPGLYTTWVYYMSNAGGFTFSNAPGVVAGPWTYTGDGTTTSFGPLANASTNDSYEYIVTINGTVDNPLNYLINYTPANGATPAFYDIAFIAAPAAGAAISLTQVSKYVPNPCYNIPLNGANTVNSDCTSLNGFYTSYQPINNYKYMMLQASSDDPLINDVLYAGGLPTIFVNYLGPNWPNPYTHYGLANFENGSVTECYGTAVPGNFGICETPTNAGYVPYSTQVYQSMRGFGYYTTSQTQAPSSQTSWPPLVPMTSAGQTPTQASINAAMACFTGGATRCSSTNTLKPNYLAPETNNAGTSEIKADATQSPIAGLLEASYDYYQQYNPNGTNSTNGCSANRYVVLVTDGLPTLDLANHQWPPLGTTSASPSPTGYGVWANFNGNGSLASTNDQALTDTINQLQTLAASGVKTYILAVGAGVDPSVNPAAASTLTAMAVAGGTNSYFGAYTEAQIDQDMETILAKILAETAATASSAVNSTGVNSSSIAYQGQFTTSDVNQDWTGNLLAFPINIDTGVIDTAPTDDLWPGGAQAYLDGMDWQVGDGPGLSRFIATWDPVAGAGTVFQWTTGNPTQGIGASTLLGQQLETFAPDSNGQHVLQFLRGYHGLELQNGGQFRERTHLLGDIVDSSPAYVAAPNAPWSSASYLAFRSQYANRSPLVYIGANDGMLHAFNATAAGMGAEMFSYIPHGVYPNIVKLANPYYNEAHQFFVDGTPQVQDVQFGNGSWHTLVLGGERAGGQTIYALDVTNPANFTSEAAWAANGPLWEFSDANLGYTFSIPTATNTAAGFAVMFGNGYNSTTSKPYFYAVNPQTGQLLPGMPMNLCNFVPTACNAALANGLSTVTPVNNAGAVSGPSNLVYAGDLQGNLWRIDVSNANSANWTATVLFQARDPGGNPQPITVAPAVTLNPNFPSYSGTMIYFGTGQFLGLPDLGNTQTQTVYGIYDNGTPPAQPLLRNSLVQQTLSSVTGTTTVNGNPVSIQLRELTATPVNLRTQKGWFVDLNLVAGERVIANPVVFNATLQLTSYQPNTSSCQGGGNGWFMVFNYATGGATAVPQFDWTGTGKLTDSDLINNQTVSGMSLGANYGASPSLLTGSIGSTTGGAVLELTLGGAQRNGQLQGGGLNSCSASNSSYICTATEAVSNSRSSWQELLQ